MQPLEQDNIAEFPVLLMAASCDIFTCIVVGTESAGTIKNALQAVNSSGAGGRRAAA